MSVKIKICGITNQLDAAAAVNAGADALGFMFYQESSRYLSPAAAAQIIQELPSFVVKVGVFVNASEDEVLKIIRECGLDLLQFHGDETPEYCIQFGLMCMKAFRIRDEASLAALPNYATDAWLLDAWVPGQAGGTGESFNWDLAVTAGKLGRPIFLAGGLTPENVGAAVQKVQPYAVDVSSGVEWAPGKKDHRKMQAFIQAVRAASGGNPGQAGDPA